jgi:hypothetical protein
MPVKLKGRSYERPFSFGGYMKEFKQLERDNDCCIRAAQEDIQAALDLINLPLKEQQRPYTMVSAIEEVRERLRSAKYMLREVIGEKK